MGKHRFFGRVVAAALVLAVASCGAGKKAVAVEGVVTLDGQPVEGAVVEFVPLAEGGRTATGVTGTDGGFRLTTLSTGDGALPGEYKVTVRKGESYANPGDQIKTDPQVYVKLMQKSAFEGYQRSKGKAAQPKGPGTLPAVYGDAAKTPLRQVVPPGGKVTIDLRSTEM